ncbi:MAG: hypothetical protein H6962_09110 [Chromatiaceae bacterium]|nr:hypothetical protein [Chromatiaceae bacterium]
MTAGATRWSSGDGDLGQLRHTLARDLMVLAELHAKAPRRDTLSALWRRCYDGVLGFKLSSDGGEKRLACFVRA